MLSRVRSYSSRPNRGSTAMACLRDDCAIPQGNFEYWRILSKLDLQPAGLAVVFEKSEIALADRFH